jgi:beta-galactosidase/beta-glucuronidase
MNQIPRPEYPRPDFQREKWLPLNGEWDFSFDEPIFDQKILVPFACETKLSGIHDPSFHNAVWYRRSFSLPEPMHDRQILLHFGAVDYTCRLWVNDQFIREHTGGQCGFSADITDALNASGENVIVLEARDDPADLEMPRGKQYWKPESESIFYTRTTGIWQSVWLEAVSPMHLCSCRITPLFDERSVRFSYALSAAPQHVTLTAEITFRGKTAGAVSVTPTSARGAFDWQIDQSALSAWNYQEDLVWTPEQPNLFDVTFRILEHGCEVDAVQSYFGMRKVSIQNGQFLLNSRPYYQKLVLDQGYWPESLLTAPSDEAFIRDIELTKAMGFNGVRKHQKVEDPRYLYHADRMGLLVWGEIGAAYLYSEQYADRIYREWLDVLWRDYNHPCIVVWTPLNESWGVQEIETDPRQQAHSEAMVAITKSMDTTRLVVDNDGWEHTNGDLLTIHDYSPSGEMLRAHLGSMDAILALRPAQRALFVGRHAYAGQPILLSEFGGVKFVPGTEAQHSWGYCEADSCAAFAGKLRELFDAVRACPLVDGYCYTQLTDVETEQNGLLTYDRTPKLPLETICAILNGRTNEHENL